VNSHECVCVCAGSERRDLRWGTGRCAVFVQAGRHKAQHFRHGQHLSILHTDWVPHYWVGCAGMIMGHEAAWLT
jgi:hypothetical protein